MGGRLATRCERCGDILLVPVRLGPSRSFLVGSLEVHCPACDQRQAVRPRALLEVDDLESAVHGPTCTI